MDLFHVPRVLDFQQVCSVPLTAVLERFDIMSTLRRVGNASLVGPCPICRAKSRKAFTVSLNGNRQLWKCFHPEHNGGGDVLTFVREYENVDMQEAAARIARWFAIDGQKSSTQRTTRRNEMAEASSNRPTHKVCSALKREGQKDLLTKIGVAWPFSYSGNKSGLNIQLYAAPIGDRLVIFENDDEDGEDEPVTEKKGSGRNKR